MVRRKPPSVKRTDYARYRVIKLLLLKFAFFPVSFFSYSADSASIEYISDKNHGFPVMYKSCTRIVAQLHKFRNKFTCAYELEAVSS